MEREEGELTDEDLEDVSDNSSLSMVPIPMILSGKSPSLSANREPFRELSLTSVSDDSEDRELRYRIVTTRSRDTNHGICHKHQYHREERKHSGTKRVRKISERRVVKRRTSSLHKEYSSVSSSSDESEYYKQDKDILRQLRDAVRINRSQKLPNCSLRTRLKRMIEPDSQGSKNSNSEDDNDLDTLRDLALQSKSKKESETPNVTDKDLIELRLIALQSAVLKKHQNRRKNKELQKKIQSEVNVETNIEQLSHMETDLLIKENIKSTADSVESKQEKIQNTTDASSTGEPNKIYDTQKTNTDDDEAILQAVLFSNISNQDNINTADDNSNVKTVTKKSSDNEEEVILQAMLISNIFNNNADSVHSNQENIENNIDNNSNKCTTTDKTENTKTNIEEDEDILRAMLLANISKKIANKRTTKQTNNILSKNNANLNKVNGIVAKTVTNPNDIKNTVKVSSVPINRFIINLNSDSDSDCDQAIIEKRKPEKAKNNDLFDKSLSLFLQQARAKSDAEHKSDISHLPKSQQLEYRRLKRKLQQLTRSRLKTTAKTKKILVSPDENKLKLVNINTTKDKSVVNQEPMSTLKSVSDEKQLNSKIDRLQVKGKYEELGPLMTTVSDARVARDKAQMEVKRLINDLRIARAELTSTHQTYTTLMQQLVKEKSLIDKRSDDQKLEIKNMNNNPPICTSTPNKVTLKETPIDISCELSVIDESVQSKDDSTKIEKDKTIVPEIEDMEIEDIPIDEEKKQSSILKYSSPLDHIQLNRAQSNCNPLSILCPYDLLGVCRDPDCSFQHCGNAITD